jgi:pimeloyl-ACP methyl ester carboxylesterase
MTAFRFQTSLAAMSKLKLRSIAVLALWLAAADVSVVAQQDISADADRKPCADLLQPYPFAVKKQMLSKGLEIAFVDEGPSPVAGINVQSSVNHGAETFVFVHGLASYLRAWDKSVGDLRKEHRCIALDLPGYGRSSGTKDVGIKRYAEVVAEFMDSLRLERVVLVGHSLGGQVVVRLALTFPKKLKRLILIDPAGIETFSEAHRQFINERYTTRYTKGKPDAIVQSDYERGFFKFPKDAQFMVQDRLAMKNGSDFDEYCRLIAECVHASVNEPVFAELGNIKTPTLIVYGTEDNMIPNSLMHPELNTIDIAKLAQKKIKGSKLIMLPECGHFSQFDCPEAMNNAIRTFLKSAR